MTVAEMRILILGELMDPNGIRFSSDLVDSWINEAYQEYAQITKALISDFDLSYDPDASNTFFTTNKILSADNIIKCYYTLSGDDYILDPISEYDAMKYLKNEIALETMKYYQSGAGLYLMPKAESAVTLNVRASYIPDDLGSEDSIPVDGNIGRALKDLCVSKGCMVEGKIQKSILLEDKFKKGITPVSAWSKTQIIVKSPKRR